MKTVTCEIGPGEAPPESVAVRLACGGARRLGVVTGTAYEGWRSVGRWMRDSSVILSRFSATIGQRIRRRVAPLAQTESRPAREDIRCIVVEELGRLSATSGGITLLELESCVHRMAEAIEALKERINGLTACGPVSDADVWREVNSLAAAESLTKDERALLAGVFRQNIALQRPELVSAGESLSMGR